MWSFFGFLIFGGYIAWKLIDDRATKEALDDFMNKEERINNDIKLSSSESDYIASQIKSFDTRIMVLEEISDELEEIYGENWREIFENLPYRQTQTLTLDYDCGIAFHILCSKKGKLPKLFSDWYEMIGNEEVREKKIKTCKIIEKNIQKVHPELEIVFMPGKKFLPDKSIKYYTELYRGKLVWKHTILPWCDEWKVIRKLW